MVYIVYIVGTSSISNGNGCIVCVVMVYIVYIVGTSSISNGNGCIVCIFCDLL